MTQRISPSHAPLLLALLAALSPAAPAQQADLKNWPAPLLWSADGQDGARKTQNSNAGRSAAITGPLPLVAVTPCRLMDTRAAYSSLGFTGPFGQPELGGSRPAQRDVPVPSSMCGIPTTAKAYSLNITVVPIGGLQYLTAWPTGTPQPNASTLNAFDGQVIANAAVVPAGLAGAISLFASGATNVIIDINGYYVDQTASGATGPQGPMGATGPAGPTGTGLPGTAGPAGLTGATGPTGPAGIVGTMGPAGAAGPAGLTGATGPTGIAGLAGAAGSTGATGATGTAGTGGAPGAAGATGATGATGVSGINGSAGAPGATGATGPSAAAGSAYLHLYNLSAQVVPLEADISFSNSSSTGFAGQSPLNAGTYLVMFTVSAVEPNQFTIYQNGAPVAGATFGSGAGTQMTTGQAIITMAAGDIITLRNHTSTAAVTLQTLAGGTQTNANASMTITRLN